jgi:hypothetical protein
MTGLITDYTSRITSEHKNKPRFLASVVAACQPFVDAQAVTNQLPAVFDIDAAIGPQLDQVGLWLGINRMLVVPITNAFFSWNTAGLGWGQGVWQGPFATTTSVFLLDDTTYRGVLKVRAAANQWNGTLANLKQLINTQFNKSFPGLSINIVDNQNMSVTYQLFGLYETYAGPTGGYTISGLTALIQQLFFAGYFTTINNCVAVKYQVYNGPAGGYSTSSVAGSLTIACNPSTASAPATSVSVSGTVSPVAHASSIHIQIGTSPTQPPSYIGAGTAGASNPAPTNSSNYQTPSTSSNTAGTFSDNLVINAGHGTYYIWAYDPSTGLAACSNPFTVN